MFEIRTDLAVEENERIQEKKKSSPGSDRERRTF